MNQFIPKLPTHELRRPDPTPRTVTAWIAECADPMTPLRVNQSYTLNLRLNRNPDPAVTATWPDGVWRSEWVGTSDCVELEAPDGDADMEVVLQRQGTQALWVARFILPLPRDADSATRQLRVRPRDPAHALLNFLVYTRGHGPRTGQTRKELCFQFALELPLAPPVTTAAR